MVDGVTAKSPVKTFVFDELLTLERPLDTVAEDGVLDLPTSGTDADLAFQIATRIYDAEFATRERLERRATAYLSAVTVVASLTSSFLIPMFVKNEGHLDGWIRALLIVLYAIALIYFISVCWRSLAVLRTGKHYVLGIDDVRLAKHEEPKLSVVRSIVAYTANNYPVFNAHTKTMERASRALRNGIILLAVLGISAGASSFLQGDPSSPMNAAAPSSSGQPASSATVTTATQPITSVAPTPQTTAPPPLTSTSRPIPLPPSTNSGTQPAILPTGSATH